MAEKPFHEPRLGLNRIYTRQGDAGETRLASGQRIPKSSPRLECFGTVDELNAFVGMAGFSAEELAARDEKLQPLAGILRRVQHELFNLGSILATLPEDVQPGQPRITDAEIERLEREIDQMRANLPQLRSFVLAGGCRLNAELHACRTVCRRAERLVVGLAAGEQVPAQVLQYLNRLGDAFFVWSRWTNHALGASEVLWDPNRPARTR